MALESLNRLVWSFRSQFSAIPEYDFDSRGEIVQNYTPIKWTGPAILSLGVSGVMGALLGVFIAISINTALVEVSLSPSFALYFGILFVFVGLIILWRTFSTSNIPGHPDDTQAARAPRRHLVVFSCLNIISGVFCFMLEKHTLLYLTLGPRLVVYTLLGMSAAFALTFGIVDLLNLLIGYCRPESARPLVESALQIYVVILSSLGMGGIFGCLFGLVDVDIDNPVGYLMPRGSDLQPGTRLAHMIDSRLCFPIGLICGALAGVANEYIGKVEASFNKLDQLVEFDVDI